MELTMSIYISNYEFAGPFKKVEEVKEKAGVYAILHNKNDLYELVEIAQSDNVRRALNDGTFELLHVAMPSELSVAVHYNVGDAECRTKVVKDIVEEMR
jgi:hypothetical protein